MMELTKTNNLEIIEKTLYYSGFIKLYLLAENTNLKEKHIDYLLKLDNSLIDRKLIKYNYSNELVYKLSSIKLMKYSSLIIKNINVSDEVLYKLYNLLGKGSVFKNIETLLFARKKIIIINENNVVTKILLSHNYDKLFYKDSNTLKGQIQYLHHPKITKREKLDLIKSEFSEVRLRIARDSSLTPSELQLFLNESDSHVLSNLALNDNLDSKLIKFLLNKNNGEINYILSRNNKLTYENLEILINGSMDDFLLMGLAFNRKLDDRLLEKIIKKGSLKTKEFIATNKKVSGKIKDLLLENNSEIIFRNVSGYHPITNKLAKRLLNENMLFEALSSDQLDLEDIDYIIEKGRKKHLKLLINQYQLPSSYYIKIAKKYNNIELILENIPEWNDHYEQYLDNTLHRIALTKNRLIPNDVFESNQSKFLGDEFYNILKRSNLTEEFLLNCFLLERTTIIKEAISRSPSLTTKLAHLILELNDQFLTKNIINNKKTSSEVLVYLLDNVYYDVYKDLILAKLKNRGASILLD
jgi:hypothetical protein